MTHSINESVASRYFHDEDIHNLTAPREIVPYVVNLLKPQSVVDVGCGLGTFAAVFQENGISDVLAVDGPWVDKNKLQIDVDNFLEVDLENGLELSRRFDLAVCLEVIEHLSPIAADKLVESLCGLSNRILFSAAIPYQGGDGHINEQPFSYWQERFRVYEYEFFDIFRDRFWNNEQVDWWYKQNMFLVARDLANLPTEVTQYQVNGDAQVRVHPDLYNARFAGMGLLIETLESRSSFSGALRTLLRIGRDRLHRLIPRKVVK